MVTGRRRTGTTTIPLRSATSRGGQFSVDRHLTYTMHHAAAASATVSFFQVAPPPPQPPPTATRELLGRRENCIWTPLLITLGALDRAPRDADCMSLSNIHDIRSLTCDPGRSKSSKRRILPRPPTDDDDDGGGGGGGGGAVTHRRFNDNDS